MSYTLQKYLLKFEGSMNFSSIRFSMRKGRRRMYQTEKRSGPNYVSLSRSIGWKSERKNQKIVQRLSLTTSVG